MNLIYSFLRLKTSLLIPLFLLAFFNISLSQDKINFDHISIEHGLSQSTVQTVLQDSYGFMWFGTLDGLNKYDGYNIKVYRPNPDDNRSLSGSNITTFYEDSRGIIWVGTQANGLNIYNILNDNFLAVRHIPNVKSSLSNNNIRSICEDNNGNLWIGTNNGLNKLEATEIEKQLKSNFTIPISTISFSRPKHQNIFDNTNINHLVNDSGGIWIATDKGLSFLNTTTENIINFTDTENNQANSTNNKINVIFPVNDTTVWIGTNSGLCKVNFDKKNIEKCNFTLFENQNNSEITNSNITAIAKNKSGDFWIGTKENGVSKFEPNTGKFENYKNDPTNYSSLSVNNISALYFDKSGILWIGTSLGGINKLNHSTDNLLHYQHNSYNENSLSSNLIRCIYQDRNDNIWIGTVDGGLNKWIFPKNEFIRYEHSLEDSNSISNNHVRAILHDSRGNFWIGTNGGGLNKFNPSTSKFKHYRHNPKNKNSISNDNIWKIIQDSQNRIWIATYGGGLNLFDPNNEIFTAFTHDPESFKSIESNYITTIFEDTKNVLWVGTWGGGLSSFVLNKNTDYRVEAPQFKHYIHSKDNLKSLGSDFIYSIFEDSDNILWVTTPKGSGLNKFDRKTETFEHYTQKHGFTNNIQMGILEDEHNNLWISTNQGLARFNKQKYSVRNYDINDGIQSNEFLVGAYCKTKVGMMLFGGINGFNAFYPDDLKDNQNIPEVVITGFKIYNDDVVLDTCIEKKKSLKLSYEDNVFSFDFVSLNYIHPEKNMYAYKMEGFDIKWNKVDNRRYATYTNIPPGKYIFKVRGSNNDNVWNKKGASIYIEITPPFWRTTWFYILSILSLITIIYLYIKIRENKLKREKQILERTVKERTYEIVEQKKEIETQHKQVKQHRDQLSLQNKEIIKQKVKIEKHRDKIIIQRDHIAKQNTAITDSIEYASRIQSAVLPPESIISQILPEHFILFKPRDIVSGDYYWINKIGDFIVIAAADCTGHGVPGAFMSMMGIAFLNDIVNRGKVLTANEILNRLRDNIINSLHKINGENQQKDGMDIALCVLDVKKRKLQFSGANNPLYLVRSTTLNSATSEFSIPETQYKKLNGTNYDLIQIKADRMPIGIFKRKCDFTNYEFDVIPGDTLYLFSDGYVDQFGGDEGRKFMSKRFKKLIMEVIEKPLNQQKEILNQTIEDWRACPTANGKPHIQLDDILVMGIRI